MNEQLQPTLFDMPDSATGLLELFPAVWTAAENLIAPEIEQRRLALEELERMGALRFSVLVVYLLATRLEEPDLPLRVKILELLGELLLPDAPGDSSSWRGPHPSNRSGLFEPNRAGSSSGRSGG